MKMKSGNKKEVRDIFVIDYGTSMTLISPDENCKARTFGEFVSSFAEFNLEKKYRPVPDALLVHYRVKGKRGQRMIDSRGNYTELAKRALDQISNNKIIALQGAYLHDAMYCCQAGLDPLSPETDRVVLMHDPAYLACVADYKGNCGAVN